MTTDLMPFFFVKAKLGPFVRLLPTMIMEAAVLNVGER